MSNLYYREFPPGILMHQCEMTEQLRILNIYKIFRQKIRIREVGEKKEIVYRKNTVSAVEKTLASL